MSQRPRLYDHRRRMHPTRPDTRPSAEGEGPVCDHDATCEVRALWPLDSESHEQFVARLRATFNRRATRQEATA